jgi:hypothetical protein
MYYRSAGELTDVAGPTTAVMASMLALTVALAVDVGPAMGDAQLSPKKGQYSGFEVYKSTPIPTQLTVGRHGNRVTSFTGQAQVRDGCENHITSFQAPDGPMPIHADGSFAARSTNYPQDGVRVKVTGTFVSRVKARGHISVRIAGKRDCHARRLFTVRRGPTTTS